MATKEHPNGYYSHNRVLAIAASCDSYADFIRRFSSAHQAAANNGWIPEVKAILPHKTYWNREMCEQEIKEKGYKNKKEFREGTPGAYSHAAKHGFLNEICKDMEIIGNYNLRQIYVYEFNDDYAYVGLTGNMKTRNQWHTSNAKSPVFQHIQSTGENPKPKIISDWMSKEEAQVYEDEMIKVYAACGWHMLNRRAGGDLGSGREQKYSLKELKAAASTCSHRREFRQKYSAMYSFILYHNLRDEVFCNLPERYTSPLYWTDEKLWKAVKDCKYSKGELQNRYPGAYISILKSNRFKEFFGDEKRKTKRRTRQEAIEESRQYKTLSELLKNNAGLYRYVRRYNLKKECFSNLEKKEMHANYSWPDIEAAINASKNLTQMRKEHTYEYRAALRREDWRRELFRRLPSRKHKSNQ